MYEDAVTSGSLDRRTSRNSRRYRCTAEHNDFRFPTHRLPVQQEQARHACCSREISLVEASDESVSSNGEEVHGEQISSQLWLRSFGVPVSPLDGNEDTFDFETLAEAYHGLHDKFIGELSELSARHEVELSASAELRKVVDQLKGTIAKLRSRNHSLVTSLESYKKKVSKLEEKKKESLSLDEAVIRTVNELLDSKQRYKVMTVQNRAAAIAKAIFHTNFAHGIALDAIVSEAKKWLRKNVFTPEQILKQMDLNGGTLNYEGISILNNIESEYYKGDAKRVHNRLLCTPSCLKRVAKVLEAEGDALCPFTSFMTPFGEAIEFDYGKATRLIIDVFGLLDVGRDRAINLTASIDAARLTKNICHTSAGIKVTDPGGFLQDGGMLHDMQSQNTIFLLKIVLTKETKESFSFFNDIFQFYRLAGLTMDERLSDEKNEEKFQWEPLQDLQPLNITCATDMAADWKLVGAGGGCKTTEMFCTLCTCPSSAVHLPNAERCQRFCSDHMDDEDWKCYHHPIASSTCATDLREDINVLSALLRADLEVIDQNSKIIYETNTNAISRTTDPTSIFYVPTNDDEKDDFVDLLFSELLLRRLPVDGDMEELRQRLLYTLELEDKYRNNLKKLQHCSALEAAIITLLHRIPCILHAENRIGIKILTMILMEGFSNALEKKIFGNISSAKDRITAYAETIQEMLNNEILGDEDGPAQWSIPMHDNGKTVGAITLDNNRIRLIMEDLERIIAVSIADDIRRDRYYYCIPEYRYAMQIVRQHNEFTDDDIVRYQKHVDCWFQTWVKLHAAAGCTNYTHMFSSGHLSEYMFKWRNLYRFSQQGFEKFNHVFSTFYFRRTNHGGRRHQEAAKTKLLAIGRWLQRRLLWMTKKADEILNM